MTARVSLVNFSEQKLFIVAYIIALSNSVLFTGVISKFEKSISSINPLEFSGKPVVIKGCSKRPVPLYAYGRILAIVQPYAKTVMYGEPCSTVPLYKAPK